MQILMRNDKTDQWDAAADNDDDDERFEPFVIDEFVGETSQRPPLLSSDASQRRFPASVLPTPASRTAVLRVLNRDHRNLRHCVYNETVTWCLTVYSPEAIIVPHWIIWSWYTGRWWVGCYIWYSEEGTGRDRSAPSPLLAVLNVTCSPPINGQCTNNCIAV